MFKQGIHIKLDLPNLHRLMWLYLVGAPSFSIVAAIDQSIRDFQMLIPVVEWLKSSGRPQVAQHLEDMLRGLYIGRDYAPLHQGIYHPHIHPHLHHPQTLPDNNPYMTDDIRSSTEYAQDVSYQTSENFDKMIRGQD